ncbi:hypothetical protein PAMC26510_13870 [Caballeronia sordidicola]|uniref:Uncharacterized protein n=1 Tax=Caballeronia sordidicola TaxID=196367 RepID=A0A242MWN0_CABSO|nr:hypothetical protein PAMC26510_13870 [Caballeronia sordidicola]
MLRANGRGDAPGEGNAMFCSFCMVRIEALNHWLPFGATDVLFFPVQCVSGHRLPGRRKDTGTAAKVFGRIK